MGEPYRQGPGDVEYATASETPLTGNRRRCWGSAFLAVCATLLLPGLGHLMLCRFRRGAFWLLLLVVWLAVCGFTMTRPELVSIWLLFVVGLVFVQLVCLVDAFVSGWRCRKSVLGGACLRYLAGIGCVVLVFYLQPGTRLGSWIRGRYVEAFAIPTSSMAPTLVPGDCFFVHKQADWKRWSLVVFRHPQYAGNVPIAKRIVGLPGETIEIVDGRIQVDGVPCDGMPAIGPYVNVRFPPQALSSLAGKPGHGCTGNPIHLGPDEYFVLGDNSPASIDARLWDVPSGDHQLGALPAECIVGRVTMVYWPLNHWRRISW